MELKSQDIQSKAIRFSLEDNGQEIGRVFLYLIQNELHPVPYGLLEDLFVVESHRNQGVGRQLVEKVIVAAKENHCTKLLATSRHGRDELHAWYERLGFKNHGVEFRMDF